MHVYKGVFVVCITKMYCRIWLVTNELRYYKDMQWMSVKCVYRNAIIYYITIYVIYTNTSLQPNQLGPPFIFLKSVFSSVLVPLFCRSAQLFAIILFVAYFPPYWFCSRIILFLLHIFSGHITYARAHSCYIFVDILLFSACMSLPPYFTAILIICLVWHDLSDINSSCPFSSVIYNEWPLTSSSSQELK